MSNVEFTETYHYNGQLKAIGKYVNDKEEGEWKWYHENGQLWIVANYVNGKLEGEWREFNENGQLKRIGNYVTRITDPSLFKFSCKFENIIDFAWETE